MPRVPRTATRRRRVGHPVVALVDGGLGDERHREVGGGGAVRPELRSQHEGFAGVGGRVGVADHAVGREAGLEQSCGLAPKYSGRHSTMSASLPASIEPTSCARPCAMAGLMVSLAM